MTGCRRTIIVARPGPEHKYAGADWTINFPVMGAIDEAYVREQGMVPLYRINIKPLADERN